jgi:hypothetical protein
MSARELLSEMPFGKYRGRLVIEIIEDNPQYLKWAMETCGLELTNEAYARYRQVMESQGHEP